jgi:hypothetical protein
MRIVLKGGFENFRPIVREEKSKKEVEEKRKQIILQK